MTALLACPSETGPLAPPAAPLRAEDRGPAARSVPSRRPLMLVAAGSLALHALVVSTLVLSERAPARMPPHEIAVEIVQEPLKSEPAKPAPPKPEPAPKAAAVEPPKPPPALAPKAQSAPTPKAPPPPASAAARPPAPAAQETQVAELRKELAALRAEHDALARAAAAAPAGAGAVDGFAAAALPSVGGEGDAASYQALVFSQLAKAKGVGRQQGRPGTAGVRFEVDDEGKLVSAELVSPSGVAALDAEALDIVKRASPFLPPPKGAQRIFMANFNFVPQAAR